MTLPAEMDGARFFRALARLGWIVARQRGSHRILRHSSGRTVIVAFHGRIRRGAIRSTLRVAEIADDEFAAAM